MPTAPSSGRSFGARSALPALLHQPSSPLRQQTLDARRPSRRRLLLGKPHAQPLQLEIAFGKRIDDLFDRVAKKATRAALAQVNELTQDAPGSRRPPLSEELEDELDFGPEDAEELVDQVANHNAQQMQRSLRAVRPKNDARSIGLQIPELSPENVQRHAQRTAEEIRGIGQSVAERIQPLVEKAVSQGLRGEALAAELQQKLGLARQDAKRVAVGQVIRINAAITEERHRKLGITRYKWRSTDDKWTRRWHRALNNTIQSYDDPPEGGGGGPHDHGNPGSADTCRCQAIPVIDDPEELKQPDEPTPANDTTPFESREALQAHLAARGFSPATPGVQAAMQRVLGPKMSPADVDAIIGHRELAGFKGARKIRVQAFNNGKEVRFSVQAAVDESKRPEFIDIRRTYKRVGDKLVAKHDLVVIPEHLQGKGLGKRLIAEQISAYERMGVQRVALDPKWIGKYYWPKLGFDVAPEQLSEWAYRFRYFLRAQKVPFAAVEAMTSDISSMRDIATTVLGDRKIGKDFLLQAPTIGTLSVDVGTPAYETMKRELGISETPLKSPAKAKAKRATRKRTAA